MTNDAVGNYDPLGGAYAFSLIGNSATIVAGDGDTELARYNTSVKYLVAYNGFRAGRWTARRLGAAQRRTKRLSIRPWRRYRRLLGRRDLCLRQGCGGAGTYTSGAPTPDTLKATLSDINAGVVAAKYKWQALTVYGGYEYAQLSSPSDLFGATPTATGSP